MKRIISLLLSAVLLIGGTFAVVLGIKSRADLSPKSLELKEFTDEVVRLIEDSEENISSSDEAADAKEAAANARVIVKSSEKINTLNAVDVAEGYNGLHILQFANEADAEKALEYYGKLSYVNYTEKDTVMTAFATESAEEPEIPLRVNPMPELTDAVGITAYREYLAENNIEYTQILTVAIIDSGIESTHEMFENRLVPNDFNSVGGENAEDEQGHGTHVAGIVVSNSLSNVKVKPYKVLDKRGEGTTLTVTLGVEAAIDDGVDVINMSLGGEGNSETLHDVIRRAYALNIPVVVASGNEGQNFAHYFVSPACFEECITVASCSMDLLSIYSFSNVGMVCDVSAPGADIKSAYIGNTYRRLTGTSMSTPVVSAAVTYLISANPQITSAEVENEIKRTSKYASDIPYWDSQLVPAWGFTALYCEFFNREMPRPPMPTVNVTGGTFDSPLTIEFTCDAEKTDIYYKMFIKNHPVGNYEVYKEPITLFEDTEIYYYSRRKGLPISERGYQNYKRVFLSDEEKYLIDDNGTIYDYFGRDETEVVPETVRGITVKAIGEKVFQNMDVVSVTLPETVETIGKSAFENCQNLREIDMKSVKKIDSRAFYDCTSLQNVNYRDLTEIEDRAFYNCENLIFSDFSNIVKVQGYAFYNAGINTNGITNIESETLTFIGNKSFCCTTVQHVDTPNLTNLGMYSFKACRSLEDINAPLVTVINEGAFCDCTALTDVNIPLAETIWEMAFNNCTSLQSLYFPNAVKLGHYGNSAVFSGCTALQSICVDNATFCGKYSFSGCTALTSLYMPHLTAVSENMAEGCTALQSVDFSGAETVYLNAFNGCTKLQRLYFPNAKSVLYSKYWEKTTTATAEYIIFDSLEKVAELLDGTSVLLPSTVTEINLKSLPQMAVIYASNGSFAYEFAVQNGIPVREITQETALLSDLPMAYNPEDVLSPDVIGFNRTYQWYGNTEESNLTGTPIDGATESTFVPSENPYYPYYYCVITSTDIGFEPTLIRTGLSKEASLCADYSAVFEQISKIPKDLSVYSEESVVALQSVLDSIVYYLPPSQQSSVDFFASDLEEAISALQYTLADYSGYNRLISYWNEWSIDFTYDEAAYTAIDEMLKTDMSGIQYPQQAELDEFVETAWGEINKLHFKQCDQTKYEEAYIRAEELYFSGKYTEDELETLYELLSRDVWFWLDIRDQAYMDETTHEILYEYYRLEGFALKDYSTATFEREEYSGIIFIGTEYYFNSTFEMSGQFAENGAEYVFYRDGEKLSEDAELRTGDVILCTNPETGEVWATARVVLYGDVNGDGAIDAMDSIMISLMNYDKLYLQGEFEKAADVNGDGVVDSLDVGAVTGFVKCTSDLKRTRAA